MLSIIIIVAAICIAVIIYAKHSGPKPDLNEVPEFIKIHEAGHFVTAYYCTAVSKINAVNLTSTKGIVELTINDSPECYLVILMAGMAAESIKLKKFRSGVAKTDLEKALEIAEYCDLEKLNSIYYRKASSRIAFEKAFSDANQHVVDRARLHDIAAIKLGFEIAKAIIEDKSSFFNKTIGVFNTKTDFTAGNIEYLFGHRGAIKIIRIIQGYKFV